MAMERAPEERIDLRGTACPLNWVKTKLRLEGMPAGARLEVVLDAGAPERNVPRSAAAEGHHIVQVAPSSDGDGVCVLIERR
jgi:TusA-related sulfurtransferase